MTPPFAFLAAEWPDVYESAKRAWGAAFPDPRARGLDDAAARRPDRAGQGGRAGLPTEQEPEDEEAKRFDLLMLNLQLAVLRDEPSLPRLSDQLKAIAGLLEEKAAIPMVRDRMPLIEAIQSDEWWQDVMAPMLETARKQLRGLVKLIEKQRRAPWPRQPLRVFPGRRAGRDPRPGSRRRRRGLRAAGPLLTRRAIASEPRRPDVSCWRRSSARDTRRFGRPSAPSSDTRPACPRKPARVRRATTGWW